MKKRVLLGMSGGVDSSVSAMILKSQGFEVVGVTFLFSRLEENNNSIVYDAKELAEQLEIEHVVIHLQMEFEREIVSYFIQQYSIGNTPFPCAKCNPKLKFKKLYELAIKYNCSNIATGHYAQIEEFNNNNYVIKGLDPEKDQSFFLWGLQKSIRDMLIFPLGNMHKTAVRAHAKELKFSKIYKRKDSLGICFIQGDNYRKFLESKGIVSNAGNFITETNEVIGQHNGIINYTIGQRRGLGININKPLFVSEIRPKSNEIVLSDYQSLFKNKISITDYYFVDIEGFDATNIFIVKVRYRMQNTPCRINIINNKYAEIELLEPLAMIATGQTAVFYDADRVIGGGFIESSE